MADAYEVLIIGGGPAGLSAGIYAARSGLKAIILDKGACGGMAATSPWIENYPGFKGISGMELTAKMKEHAEDWLEILTGASVDDVATSGRKFSIKSGDKTFESGSIVLATGTEHRKLGIPGENELAGRGVSYCATCDGAFFREKKVVVVGGGNNGTTEALHLRSIGCDVTLIHRRDTLRAEKHLQDQLAKEKVGLLLNTTVEKICGNSKVDHIEIKVGPNGNVEELETDGIFISIGELPNTRLAERLGVDLNEYGYITTDRKQRTNIERVYAAGDVTGGLRQVITACAEGAVSAMSAFEDLKTPYWAPKR